MLKKRCRLIVFRALMIISLGCIGMLPAGASAKARPLDFLSTSALRFSNKGLPIESIPTPQPYAQENSQPAQNIPSTAAEPQPLPKGISGRESIPPEILCASQTPGKTERCLQMLPQTGQATNTLTIPGSLLRIDAANNGRLGVTYHNLPQFFGGNHSGVYLWLNGMVFGPQPWGGGREYTPVSHQISGNGSAAVPWKITTVFDAGSLLRLTQEITYIDGQERLGFAWTVQNISAFPISYSLFHAADFMTEGQDSEFGYYQAGASAVGGHDLPASHYQYLLPGTPKSSFFIGPFEEVWSRIGYNTPGTGFNNTIRSGAIDLGAGLQWNNLLAAAAQQVIKDTLVYSAQSQTNYHISGRVLNDAGMPLAGVTISASGGYIALTDADGYYTLTDLPAGRYMLAASLKDYTFTVDRPMPLEVPRDQILVNFTATAVGSKSAAGQLSAIQAEAGEAEIGQTALYSVSGKIIDGQGWNLVGVSVTINATHTAVTNSAGFYEIGGLAAGKYTITPAMSGYAFTPASASITIPGRTTNIDFSATPTTAYQVSGKVTRPGGTVGLIGVSVYADDLHMGLTDGQGNYAISGLIPGTYTIRAVWDGYTFTTATTMPLTLSGDAVVDFSGEPNPYWISGTVTVKDTGLPLPGVTVSTGCGFSAVTDAAGYYTISGLDERAYYVRASLKGFSFPDTPIQTTLPPSQETVNIVATPLANMIQGSLVMSSGATQPLAGIEISTGGYTAITDINGHFSLAGLAAGDHTLQVKLSGFALTPADIIATAPTSADVAITAVPYEYTISGIILNSATSGPLPAATVWLGTSRKMATNVNGYFIFGFVLASSTPYTITAGMFGYEMTQSSGPSPVNIPPSQVVTYQATFLSKVGKIEGLLLNSNPNEYLTGVTVVAKPVLQERCSAGQQVYMAVSDVNGFYQIGGLAGGDYGVEVVKNGYSFTPQIPYLTTAPRSGLIFNGEATSDASWVDGHLLSVGTGLPGAYVYLREGAGNSTFANANGYYRIAGLPAGGYTVVPSLDFYTFSTSTAMPVRVGDTASVPGKTVDFEAANSSSATPMYFVSGKIKTPKGTSVPFIPLTLNPGGYHAATDRSGNYSIGWLTAGTYTITPSNPDSETNCQFAVKKSGSGSTPPLQVVLPQTGALTSVTDGDFEATCTMNVSGRIIDEDGAGVAGVTVVAKPSLTANTVTATSAADGRFILPALGEGPYNILPTSSGYRYTPQSFQINPPVNIALPEFTAEKLPVMYRVSGTVKDSLGRPLSGVTISDNAGDAAISDPGGYYELGFAIDNLPAGVDTLEIVPSQGGFFFTPATRSLPVAPLVGRPPNPTSADITGVDFTAVAN